MKKKFFYIAMVALALTGCSDSLSTIGSSDGNSEITIPAEDAEAGELLINSVGDERYPRPGTTEQDPRRKGYPFGYSFYR